jgi:hypothetical protein
MKMKTFKIRMTVTEVTRQVAYIEAETEAEAIAAVEGYEFDNSHNEFDDSLQWTVDDVESLGEAE